MLSLLIAAKTLAQEPYAPIRTGYLSTRPAREISHYTPDQLGTLFDALQKESLVDLPPSANEASAESLISTLQNRDSTISGDLMVRAIAESRKPPVNEALLNAIADIAGREPFHDANIAASATLAAMRIHSTTIPADADVSALVHHLMALGRDDIAAQFLLAKSHRSSDDVQDLIVCLTRMSKFSSACRVYTAAHSVLADSRPGTILYAAFAAAETSDTDMLDKILAEHAQALRSVHAYEGVAGMRDILLGKTVDDDAWTFNLRDTSDMDAQRVLVWMLCELDLGPSMPPHPRYIQDLIALLNRDPLNRISWLMLDGYFRRWPSPTAGGIYGEFRFLQPDMPDIGAIVTEWEGRKLKSQDPPAMEELPALQQSYADRWPAKRADSTLPPAGIAQASPLAIGCRVAMLARQSKFREARDLALRFHDLAVQYHTPLMQTFANHLIHRVDQCAGSPSAAR